MAANCTRNTSPTHKGRNTVVMVVVSLYSQQESDQRLETFGRCYFLGMNPVPLSRPHVGVSSPSTVPVPETELWSAGFVARAFTCRAILLAHFLLFIQSRITLQEMEPFTMVRSSLN